MITLGVKETSLEQASANILVVFMGSDADVFQKQVKRLTESSPDLAAPLASEVFQGKEGQTLLTFPRDIHTKLLLLVGLGASSALSMESLRRAAATAVKQAVTVKATNLGIYEPDPLLLLPLQRKHTGDLWETVGLALAEGASLAAYTFDQYRSRQKDAKPLKSVTLLSSGKDRRRRLEQGVTRAKIICAATYLARDLENTPAGDLHPESLARHAVESGRNSGYSVRVLDVKKIKALNMGGLLGVSQGSARPPRFIVMEYNRHSARKGTVVLVGKGVTFDSGGISIKPSAGMAEMKMDMSGAAAVIGTMQAAAQLKLPLHLVGLIPATENLPGGRALKPGDILKHYNGMTSEVDNTDAEGRLILADALGYADTFKPDLVIDLATLTGAVVVALGHVTTGMMGNDPVSMERLKASGNRTFERVWELPLFDEYERLIKSDVADVKNVGGRWAGAITAAMFLKKFIGTYKWVHLDIAGTAIVEEPTEYIPKGGSGVGVRLLTDFLTHWKRT